MQYFRRERNLGKLKAASFPSAKEEGCTQSQGLSQPVLGGKEKAAACTDSRPSVSTSKLDGQRSYASPKSKSGRPDVTDVKEKASSAYETFFIGASESLA